MEAATKRSGVDRRKLSRLRSVGHYFFPSLAFFGSFFGNEKKNIKIFKNKKPGRKHPPGFLIKQESYILTTLAFIIPSLFLNSI